MTLTNDSADLVLQLWTWLFGKEREIRTLNRDSKAIIASLHGTSNAEQLRAIAQGISDNINEAHRRSKSNPATYGPIIAHFQALHRDAGRLRQQRELSIYTLVIIYLRAETHGADCHPARAAVEQYLDLWRLPIEPTTTTDPGGAQ